MHKRQLILSKSHKFVFLDEQFPVFISHAIYFKVEYQSSVRWDGWENINVHQMEEEMCNLSNEVNLWLKNENNLKTSSNKVTNDRVHLLLSKPQKFVFYGSQKNSKKTRPSHSGFTTDNVSFNLLRKFQ